MLGLVTGFVGEGVAIAVAVGNDVALLVGADATPLTPQAMPDASARSASTRWITVPMLVLDEGLRI